MNVLVLLGAHLVWIGPALAGGSTLVIHTRTHIISGRANSALGQQNSSLDYLYAYIAKDVLTQLQGAPAAIQPSIWLKRSILDSAPSMMHICWQARRTATPDVYTCWHVILVGMYTCWHVHIHPLPLRRTPKVTVRLACQQVIRQLHGRANVGHQEW